MIVWLCQAGETPSFKSGQRKMRTSLLAEELCRRGHEVVWWASLFDHQKKAWRESSDVDPHPLPSLTVKYLRGCGYKKNVSPRRFLDHRIIAHKFKKACLAEKVPDLIIASLPTYDMAVQAARYAKKNDVPLLVDVRDQWPEIFVKYLPPFLAPLVRAALVYDFKIFRESLKTAFGITSMMETILHWSLGYAERPASESDKVFYLGALKPLKFAAGEIEQKLQSIPKDHLCVAFVGTFGNQNNPTILIQAAELLRDAPISFVLGGNGVHFETLKKRSEGLPNVHLLGWLNESEMNTALRRADLAVCPTPPNVDVLPNKVFVYFSHGVPVLSSSHGDLAHLIEKDHLGSQYEAENLADFCAQLKKYLQHPELLQEQRQAVIKKFNDHFEASTIYRQFADHLEKVVRDHAQSAKR